MKTSSLAIPVLTLFVDTAFATQADYTTITITGQKAGATPFLSQLTLTTASDTTVIKSIHFRSRPSPVLLPAHCPEPTPKITLSVEVIFSHQHRYFFPRLRALRWLYKQRHAHL